MAEISIWTRDDDESQGMRKRMADMSDLLRKRCREKIVPASTCAISAVDDALQALIDILEAGGVHASRAATDFGRLGGHMSLLQLLEAGLDDDDQATERTRELAARAVDLCMAQCPRFPLKAAALDAKNICDTMCCSFEIDSPMNNDGGMNSHSQNAEPLLLVFSFLPRS
jgi:hypothetical protein